MLRGFWMLTKKNQKGSSIVEVIVAIAIFVILASGSVAVILGSLLSSRQGEEETRAAYLAQEGIYATESIRNQDFALITDGAHGLLNTSGKWAFSGTTQTIGKFTRVVTVSPVQRLSSGDITISGGTLDANTKLVNSKVTWNFTPGNLTTVDVNQYFTNWGTSMFATPVPTALPNPTSCPSMCLNNGYVSGTCRANAAACTTATEINATTGNVFCTGGANFDTCCCHD